MNKRLTWAMAASALLSLASCSLTNLEPSASQAPSSSASSLSSNPTPSSQETSLSPAESTPISVSSTESLPSSSEESLPSESSSMPSEEPSSSSESSPSESSSSDPVAENAPVYQGMSIVNVEQKEGEKGKWLPKRNADAGGREKEDEIETDIDDIAGIDIHESSETEYFVKPGDTFIVEVHLSNPYDFEIQSFTLNGNKYSSYMFERGSTMELLRLELTAPEEPGLKEYTIDAIKYIDGTQIKDVRMSGEKTIKAGFTYPDAPQVIANCDVATTGIQFSLDITDPWNRISANTLHFYMTDGRSIILDQPLSVGHSEIAATALRMSKAYQYGVIAAYDLLDGDGLHSTWLVQETLHTKSAVTLQIDAVTEESLTFSSAIDYSHPIDNLVYSIIDETTGATVKEVYETGTVDGLLSNHDYSVYADYGYNAGGKNYSDWNKTDPIHTGSKVVPTFAFSSIEPNKTGVTYSMNSDDPSLIGQLESVSVYDGESLVASLTQDSGEFHNLLSDHAYSIVAEFSYDLNDGNGKHTEQVKAAFSTNAKVVPGVFINGSLNGTTASYSLSIDDPDGIATIEEVAVYRNGSETAFRTKEGVSTGDFEELWTNSSYVMVAKIAYDLNDGSEPKYAEATWPFSIDAKMAPSLGISYTSTSHDSVSYNLSYEDWNSTLVSYAVELVDSGTTKAKQENELSGTFQGVLSNHRYLVRLSYVYDLGDGEGQHTIETTAEVETLAKALPTASLTNLVHEGNDVVYSFDIQDPNATIVSKKVRLVADGQTVMESTDCDSGAFKNVTEDIAYSVVLDYSYNLNEGGEDVPQNLSCEVPLNAFYYDEDGTTLLGRDIFYKGSEPSFDGELPTKADDLENKLQYSFGEWEAVETTPSRIKFVPSFESCTLGLRFDNYGVLVGYDGDATDVVLPKRWNGRSITTVGDNVFQLRDDIKSVVIPDGYMTIRDAAFEDCKSLTSVTIPDSVVNINSAVFRRCTSLESITLPNGLLAVDQELFNGCTSLTNIVIPDSATYIGPWAFGNCTSLTNVEMGNGVERIGYNAFGYCSSLQSIFLPASLKMVDGGIFSGSGASDFVIYAEAEKAGSGWLSGWNGSGHPVVWGATEAKHYDFNGIDYACTTKNGEPAAFVIGASKPLDTFNIPDTIDGRKVVGVNFRGLEESADTLTSVSIPDGATIYDDINFNSFGLLTQFKIGAGVTSAIPVLPDRAFYGCYSLTSVDIPDGITTIQQSCFEDDLSLVSVNIPNSVTSIWSSVFKNCSSLASIGLPDSLEQIDDWTFGNCTSLVSIDIPESVTRIGNYAFNGCAKLANFNFSHNLKTLGEAAFGGTAVESVTIPNSLTSIGSAFSGCKKLISVTIENGVKSIPEGLCWSCTSLSNITIPSTVVTIGGGAFYDCPLEYVTIPKSVVRMGSRAFDGAAVVGCQASEKPAGWADDWAGGASVYWGVDSLSASKQDGIHYVIVNYGDSKMAAVTGVDETVIDLVIPSAVDDATVTGIANSAFTGNKAIQSVVIPDTVSLIGSDAFYSCESLQSLQFLLPDGDPTHEITIGQRAFYGCPLQDVTIPINVTKIGSEAFVFGQIYCAAESKPDGWAEDWNYGSSVHWNDAAPSGGVLNGIYYEFVGPYNNRTAIVVGVDNDVADLVIPSEVNGATVIGIAADAFKGNTKITSVVIPSGVTSIGENAFYQCSSLLSVTFLSAVPPTIGSDAFGITWDNESFKIYVPAEAVDAYKNIDAPYWQEYGARRVTAIEE